MFHFNKSSKIPTIYRKLGTITLEEADFSLRLLAGAVARQLILSRQNVSVDSFWPVGTSRQSYEGFPCQRINDQWDEIFNHFMDEKRGEWYVAYKSRPVNSINNAFISSSTQAIELLEIEGLAIEFRKGALATVTNNTLTFAIYNDETKFDFIDLDMSSICTTKIRDNVLSVIELNLNDKASVKVNGQVHATDKMVIYFKSFAAASRIQLSIEQRKKGSQNDLAKVVINKDGCARLVIDVKHRVSSATVDLACSDKIGRHSATEISSSSRNIPNASIGDERPRESRRPWSVARLQLPSEGEVIDKSEKYLFQKNALETNITSPSATNKIERTPNWKAVGRNRDNTTVIKTQESEPNIESGLINFTGDEIIPDSLGSIDRKKSAVVNELDEADECQKGERMPRPAGQIELQISHITSSPPSQNHHRLDLLTNDSQIVQTNPAADEAAGLPREQYHLATPKPTRDMAGPEDTVGRDGQNSGNAPMASVGSKLKRPRLKPAGPVTRNSPTNWSLDLSATDNERSQQPQASSRTKTKPKKPITEDSGKLDRPNGNAKLFSEKRRQLHLQPLPLTPKTGSALNKSNGANNARTDASDGKFNVERQAQPLTSGRPSREAAVKAKAKMMMTNRYENEVHDSDALDDPIESSFLVDHKDEVESIEKALTPDPTQERTKGNITREQNTTISSETNQQQAGICDCRTLSDDQILFNAHQDTINVPSTKTRFDNIHAKPLNKSSVSYGHFCPRKEDNQPLGSRPGVSELSKNVAKFISRQQDQATTKQSYENDDQQIRRFTSPGDSINEEVGNNSREKTPKPNAGKETLCPKMTNQPYGDLTQLEFGEKKQSRRAENELNQGLNLTTKNLQVINHNENKRKIPMDSPQKSKSSSICEVTREDFHSHIRDSPPRFSQSQRVDENGSPIPRRIVKPVFRKNFGRSEAIPKTLDDKWDCSDSGDLLSEKITFGSEDTGKHIDSTKQKTNDIQSDSSSELKSDSSSSSEEFEPILPAIQSRRKIIRHASPEASFFWLPRTKRQVQPKEKLDNTLPEARPVKRRIESPKKRKNEFSKKRKVESPKQKYARQKRSSEVDSETETHTTSSYPYTSFSDATTLVEPDTDVEIEWQRALRASQKTSLEIMLDTSRVSFLQ